MIVGPGESSQYRDTVHEEGRGKRTRFGQSINC